MTQFLSNPIKSIGRRTGNATKKEVQISKHFHKNGRSNSILSRHLRLGSVKL